MPDLDANPKYRSAAPGSAGERLASLDGLRAVSIALVCLSHLYASKAIPGLGFLWRFQLGDLGVRIFFVISGFLITHLLITEQQRTGTVSLKNFFIRRVLRIFPAYYALLAFVAVCAQLGYLQVTAGEWLKAALYVSNYFDRPQALAHSWSLSVEEQFYILWPLLILALRTRRAIALAAAFALLVAAIRAAHSFPIAPETNVFWVRFETAGDAIAIGCVFAALRHRLWTFAAYRAFTTPAGTLAASVAVAALATSHHWPWFWNSIGITLMNVCIVLILDGCMRARGHWHFTLLNSVPVVTLGGLSYSLYLWQQLFLTSVWKVPFPLSLLLAVAAGAASYYLLERPVARLKDTYFSKQKPRRTAGSPT